ncbi:T-box transcription factor TBX22 isoform X1 [Corvus moneduloides]|uniref:T-box transcription factor TBX22 isoform X1 n=1 Tax=Corvus moneduloides TaxID=1196302 RepID=UPI0013637ADC|nr:T-box transcription factor TBX22 isoform X1 [Corvus moneduloides]
MALSSRAHAFSVEALVGRSAKRKVPEGRDEEPGPGCRPGLRAPEAEKRPKAGAESRAGGVQVELQGSELWRRFHDIGTEMIITKAGRRMFPSVRVKVKGLEPLQQYYIAIDVVPVDSKRYRYVYHSSQWMVAGNTDHSCITPRLYIHPDSPCSGETWMRQIISFDRVKLTNNEMDDKGHIILQSMHKYKPRVHVIAQDSRFDLAQIQSLPAEGVQTFSFQETEFTTVTAYQNQQITKLKIDRNPFAKGFRDPGRNRGVLDGLLETYPWRTPLALDFKAFGADSQGAGLWSAFVLGWTQAAWRPGEGAGLLQGLLTGCGHQLAQPGWFLFSFPGGSSSSSPVASSGGTPSPLNPLLSPSCSPPTLHLPASNLGVSCPESFLHPLNVPLYYKICPTSFLRQQALLFPSHEKLGATNPHLLPHFMVDMPKLSSLKNAKAEDLNTQCLQAPGSAGQMLYGLHASGNIFPSSPIAREALNCSLHPPYGVYGYNFSVPSRLMNAAGHFKVSDSIPAALRDGRCNHSNWHPTINHCL